MWEVETHGRGVPDHQVLRSWCTAVSPILHLVLLVECSRGCRKRTAKETAGRRADRGGFLRTWVAPAKSWTPADLECLNQNDTAGHQRACWVCTAASSRPENRVWLPGDISSWSVGPRKCMSRVNSPKSSDKACCTGVCHGAESRGPCYRTTTHRVTQHCYSESSLALPFAGFNTTGGGGGIFRAGENMNLQILVRQNLCHFLNRSKQIMYDSQKLLMRNSGHLLLFPSEVCF